MAPAKARDGTLGDSLLTCEAGPGASAWALGKRGMSGDEDQPNGLPRAALAARSPVAEQRLGGSKVAARSASIASCSCPARRRIGEQAQARTVRRLANNAAAEATKAAPPSSDVPKAAGRTAHRPAAAAKEAQAARSAPVDERGLLHDDGVLSGPGHRRRAGK
jgi:hypothetical protein